MILIVVLQIQEDQMNNPKKHKSRVVRHTRPSDSDAGQTITEFCAEERISPSTYFYWQLLDRQEGVKPGHGRLPVVSQPNGPRGLARIYPEAKAEWRARRSGKFQSQPTA
jgi:hypothetical protein